MQNHSKIESFFSSLQFNWQDLIEFLPVGVIIFDENWKIKSVNRNFINFFENEIVDIQLEGINLFSKNSFSEKLPLKEILLLKKGKHFESNISFKTENDEELNLVIKGSPIFKNSIFQGGVLIIEDYQFSKQAPSQFFQSSHSISNFLNKICNCFLIIDKIGTIQIVSGDNHPRCAILQNSRGKNISDLFGSELSKSVKSALSKAINENKAQSLELSYFSDKEKITFNSVFIPLAENNDKDDTIVVLLREKKFAEEDSISYLSNSSELKEFQSFATAGADGLFKINLHGNITYWAENSIKLFSISEHEILSEFIGKIFPEITHEYFENIRKKILSNGSWEGYLTSQDNIDNNIIRVKIISKVLDSETDLFVYCNQIDRHQQKMIAAREEEKLFFKDAVLKSNQMILQANPNGTILFTNEKFCNKYGYELDEIRGKQFTDLIETKFKAKHRISDFEILLNKKEFEVLPLISKSGNIIEVCFSINLSTTNSELKYFTIYFRECSLKDKLFLETAHALLYQFPDPVVIIHDDRIIKVNPKFCELFGSEFEANYFDMPIKKIVDSNSENSFKKILLSNSVSNNEDEISLIRDDKSIFEANVKKIYSSKDTSFSVLIIKSLVEEKTTVLTKSEIIQKQFDKIDSYFWSGLYQNDELEIDYIDSEFVKSMGYLQNDFVLQPSFLEEITHPDDREKVRSELLKLFEDKNELSKEITFRLINKEGGVVWINNRIRISVNDKNDILTVYGSIADVTQEALEREELKSIINELDQLNTAKEKFISIISHDLKSPFTSIVGFAELIQTDTTLEKAEIIEFVGHIRDASLHTVDLLNGLLDLTKLQTGRIEVEPKIVNANYIAHKTVEILSGLAFQKGLTLKSYIDKSIYIMADDNLILQVFNNLVANSIKFTPKGGSIEIFAKELPNQQRIEFTVKDSGVGMEKEDMEKLFVLDKKFTTLGTEGERGTGLGLSLVKEIIDKHKGEIYTKSEINKGSEFVFTLPISSPCILVVDGVKAERVLYTRLLESITDSIEIIHASNEAEGLRIIKEKMPMLIVFEHSLPNMKGDDFIGEIVKAELVYQPSLIVLTKEYSEELNNSYKGIGAHDVFSKPFDLKSFKIELDKLIGKIE
jgi:two-component system, sensor histidine kinase and response regulator